MVLAVVLFYFSPFFINNGLYVDFGEIVSLKFNWLRYVFNWSLDPPEFAYIFIFLLLILEHV
jgi:hypothetical protein